MYKICNKIGLQVYIRYICESICIHVYMSDVFMYMYDRDYIRTYMTYERKDRVCSCKDICYL